LSYKAPTAITRCGGRGRKWCTESGRIFVCVTGHPLIQIAP
jgi:hypothetical protein